MAWTAEKVQKSKVVSKNINTLKKSLDSKVQQIKADVAKPATPVNPFPHRSDLKANIANNQPTPKLDSLSYLKPIEQTKKGNVIDLKLPVPKKQGYVIGGLTVGDMKGHSTQDKRPVTILSDDGQNVTVKNQDGFTQTLPKQYLTTTHITPDKEKTLLRNARAISDRMNEKSLADSYKNMNPVESFLNKAADINKGVENTPSLGGLKIPNKIPLVGGSTVPDIGANVLGTLLGLATPTGAGNTLGGAMNEAGNIVESGVQKYGGKVLNKLPKVAQKILPKATREVGEGLMYSASKAPEYTAKDWATNALQDATIGTGLGMLMDGAKNIPESIDNAKVKAKSKAIDKVYKQYTDNGLYQTNGVKTSTSILKPSNNVKSIKPTTLNKTLTLKNKGEETAYKRLEDGIIKAQNYFQTNQLRAGEMEQF
jgi:hypothetical protein